MDKNMLLKELKLMTNRHHEFFKQLLKLDQSQLYIRLQAGSWNILEVTEHLKRYSDFYLPTIEQALAKAPTSGQSEFNTGWLGDYFANAMKPGTAKMNTFKSKNPLGEEISVHIISEFLCQLEKIADILELSRNKNLSKIKVKTTIPVVKINAGDALRVVIYHNDRHVVQIKSILNGNERSNAGINEYESAK